MIPGATVLIILSYMAPHGTASDVFTQFYNGGAWPTQGLSIMVGLIGLVFAFVGELTWGVTRDFVF